MKTWTATWFVTQSEKQIIRLPVGENSSTNIINLLGPMTPTAMDPVLTVVSPSRATGTLSIIISFFR
jgi:hypothetical protein